MRASYYVWWDSTRTPQPEPWDVEGGGSGPAPNAAFQAAVFRRLEQLLLEREPALAEPLERLEVFLTANPAYAPRTGPNVVMLLLWDNWARVPAYAGQVGLVLAPTRSRSWGDAARALPRPVGWTELVDEGRVRVERERWARRHAKEVGSRPDGSNVVEMPLGYAYQREVPYVAWGDRDVDVFFAGSAVHGFHRGGFVRKRLRTTVGNVKTLHRNAMLAAAEELKRKAPHLRVEVELVDADEVSGKADRYSELMMRSRLCLDPRGTSRETFRFYEAERVGTIPIVTSLPSSPLYDSAPALRLRHWSQVPEAVPRLLGDEAHARELHEGTRSWWQEVGGEEATAQRLLEPFTTLLRRLAATG